MKNYLKKAALVTLAGTMVMGSMTGCGSSKVDGTQTISTINDEELKLGTVNFMLRYQQAQTEQMYQMYFGMSTDGMWSQVADEETGETYGDQSVKDGLKGLEDMVILRQHAEEYEVTLPDEEKEKIQAAAKGFMEANTKETIEHLGVSQENIEQALELSYYKDKMYDPITKDVDTEVSDEEAAQTGITYVMVSGSSEEEEDAEAEEEGTEEDAEEAPEDEEESAEEASEESKGRSLAEAKNMAQEVLDQVLAAEKADMKEIASGVDESLSAVSISFKTNPEEDEVDTQPVPKEVMDAVKGLKDGEVVDKVLEVDDGYYVVRLDAAFDEKATDEEKETIVTDRKEDAYSEITEKWREDSKIVQNEKVLKKLKMKDNDKYTFKAEETEGAAEDTGAGETEDSAAEDAETSGNLSESEAEVSDDGEIILDDAAEEAAEDDAAEDNAAEDNAGEEDAQ